MNLLFDTVIGGIIAGLISTGLYELIRFYYDRWLLLNHPVEYKYIGPNEIDVYNTHPTFSAFFNMRNRTNKNLQLSIRTTSCNRITYESAPIEWIGKQQRFGLQNLSLSPSEWGTFKIMGMVSKPGKCEQPHCEITISMEVRIPIQRKKVEKTIGTLKLEFKP